MYNEYLNNIFYNLCINESFESINNKSFKEPITILLMEQFASYSYPNEEFVIDVNYSSSLISIPLFLAKNRVEFCTIKCGFYRKNIIFKIIYKSFKIVSSFLSTGPY